MIILYKIKVDVKQRYMYNICTVHFEDLLSVDNGKYYGDLVLQKYITTGSRIMFVLLQVQSDELLRKDLECRDYLDEAKYYQLSLAQVIPDVNMSEKIRPRKSYAGTAYMFCVINNV